VVERINMINDYLRGRVCIESVRGVRFRGVWNLSFSSGSFCFGFEFFLGLLCHFAWLAAFRAFCGPCNFSFF
jgi:hypothetical protein